uniref:ribonuclease H n=1 Tax=Caenorhabditis tropicalis TaxID=1561998 RepID=A0A1I7UCW8_9PELO
MSGNGQPPNVYTDGSCRNQGNPNAVAGYGVFWGQGHANNRSGTVSGHQDSNRAELRAAQQAIQTASRQGYSGINIHSDSHYVRNSINNSAKYQSAPANRDLMQSINSMKSNVSVNTQHVKGHSGHIGNSQAHSLARNAANSGKK